MRFIFLFFLSLALFSLAAAENLILNPGMLPDKNGKISHWIVVKAKVAHKGQSIELSPADTKNRMTIFQRLNIQPDVDYLFEYDYRSLTCAPGKIYCEVITKDSSGRDRYTTFNSGRPAAPEQWAHVTIPVRLTGKWKSFYVAAIIPKGHTGNVQVKNLVFRKAQGLNKVMGGHWSVSAPHKLNAKAASVTVNGSKKPYVSINAIPVKPGFEYRIDYVAAGKSQSGNQSSAMHVYGMKISPEVPGGVLFQDLYQFGTQAKHHKFKIPANSSVKHVNLTIIPSTPGTVEFKDFRITSAPIDMTTSWRIQLDHPHTDGVYSTVGNIKVKGKLIADANAKKAFVAINGKNKVEVKLTKGIGNFALDLPKALGKYELKATFITRTNQTRERVKTLIKCAPAKNAVKFPDGKRCTVGGKPFFPLILWYGSQEELDEKKISYLAAHGVNTLFTTPWEHRRNKAIYLNLLNVAWKHGLRVFLGCGHPKNMKEVPQFKKIADSLYTREIIDHPAFLGTFFVDEPLWMGIPSEPLFAGYSYLKEKMPNHQVFINAAPRYEVEDLRPYSDACDIYGVDVYPIPYPNHHSGIEDKSPSSLGKYTKRMLEVVRNRKPIVMTLQGGSWSEWGTGGTFKRYPTASEMRYMAMDSLSNGAAMCSIWGFGHIRDVRYVDLLMNFFSELHKLSGIFTHGTQLADLPVREFRTAVFKYKNNLYYIALNPSGKKVKGSLLLPDKPEKVTFYLDNKSVKTQNGKITLDFAPYTAYVFGANALPPASVLPPKPAGPNPFIKECHDRYVRANRKTYSGTANWIWDASKLQVNAKCRVALEFNIADTDVPVELMCAADDLATIYVNGFEVKKIKDWRNMYCMNLRKFLTHGSNLLVVEAQDYGSLPCGVLAELNINGKKFVSDGKWKVLPVKGDVPAKKPADYNKLPPVKIMAPYSEKPWGRGVKVIPEN